MLLRTPRVSEEVGGGGGGWIEKKEADGWRDGAQPVVAMRGSQTLLLSSRPGGRLTLMSSQTFLRVFKCALSSLTVLATPSSRKHIQFLTICWEWTERGRSVFH